MLPGLTLPGSLRVVLDGFRGSFTRPTFVVFCAMVVGLITQTGDSTVCGMLTGAGLAGQWSHDRAHQFFSRARWSVEEIGLTVLDLIVAHLLDPDTPVTLAVDDTAHRRSGPKVTGAAWVHDGSAPGRGGVSFGHRWVVVGVVIGLPFRSRPVCLPVACARWQGKGTPSVVTLAAGMVTTIAERLPDRRLHVQADAAYHSTILQHLPPTVTWTTRVPRNAVFHAPTPPRTGRRGRPRSRGARLGTPTQIAATLTFTETTVTRYGRTETTHIAALDCLWYGVFAQTPVRLILIRDRTDPTTLLALVTTDPDTTPADLVTRYATRWPIETTFHDTRHTLGVGQARNRTPHAVARTWPLGMYTYSLVVLWYTLAGHHTDIVTHRRHQAPWYTTKTDPSFTDMLTTLRHTLITHRHIAKDAAQPTPEQIRHIKHIWDLAAA